MTFNESLHSGWRGGLADGFRNVNREKIRRINKAVHGLQTDVVGIHMP